MKKETEQLKAQLLRSQECMKALAAALDDANSRGVALANESSERLSQLAVSANKRVEFWQGAREDVIQAATRETLQCCDALQQSSHEVDVLRQRNRERKKIIKALRAAWWSHYPPDRKLPDVDTNNDSEIEPE